MHPRQPAAAVRSLSARADALLNVRHHWVGWDVDLPGELVFRFATPDCKYAMGRNVRDLLRKLEIISELRRRLVDPALPLRYDDAVPVRVVADVATNRRLLSNTLREDVTGPLQCLRRFACDILIGCFPAPDTIRERFVTGLACNGSACAALGFVWKIEIFEYLFGICGKDARTKRIIELSLLFDR